MEGETNGGKVMKVGECNMTGVSLIEEMRCFALEELRTVK